MKTCYKCEMTEYEHKFDRTTDGKDICLNCMSEAQDHYKKGLLSSEEIDKYYQLKKEYKEKIMEIVLLCKKQGKHNNEDPVEILKEVIELEESLALTSFKKGRGFHKANINLSTEVFKGKIPLTIEEHYLLVQQILDNFDIIRKPMTEEVKILNSDANGRYEQFAKKNYKARYII